MKKKPPMKKPILVEVSWQDSQSHGSPPWRNVMEMIDEYRKNGLDTIRSIGYLIDRTDDYLLMTGDLQFNENWQISNGSRFYAIPAGCVKRIKRLDGIGADGAKGPRRR